MSTKQEKHNVANPSASTYTVLPQFEQSITCCKEREKKKSAEFKKKEENGIFLFMQLTKKKKKLLFAVFHLIIVNKRIKDILKSRHGLLKDGQILS